ncbi:MAG: DUF4864 domain-containing protein [Bradyrhizobium sp.]
MRALILLITCLTVLTTPVAANDDIAAAQTVIQSQERAMLRDDAATAYSHAGPPITSMYREPDIFMWMVRRGYAPVYRHQSFEFGAGRILGNQITQEVHIIDAEGVAWEALYTLEQQSDGSWKIISCVLSKAVGA